MEHSKINNLQQLTAYQTPNIRVTVPNALKVEDGIREPLLGKKASPTPNDSLKGLTGKQMLQIDSDTLRKYPLETRKAALCFLWHSIPEIEIGMDRNKKKSSPEYQDWLVLKKDLSIENISLYNPPKIHDPEIKK